MLLLIFIVVCSFRRSSRRVCINCCLFVMIVMIVLSMDVDVDVLIKENVELSDVNVCCVDVVYWVCVVDGVCDVMLCC